jgi:hypothetical protein
MFDLNIRDRKLVSLNNIFKYSALLIMVVMGLYGCKKSETYSNVPLIEYKSGYSVPDQNVFTDTLLGVVFSYKDGDGDIGLNPEDTFPPYNSIPDANGKETNPYYYNLNIEYLTLVDGEFKPVIIPNTTDTLRFNSRLQNITPDGKYKAIRGDIDWRILPPSGPAYAGLSRTIKLRISIYDRALNKSNIAESPIIKLP